MELSKAERQERTKAVLARLGDRLAASGVPPEASDLPEYSAAIISATTALLDALYVWRETGAEADLPGVDAAWYRCLATWRRAAAVMRCTIGRRAARR